jgi:hypothetical protein
MSNDNLPTAPTPSAPLATTTTSGPSEALWRLLTTEPNAELAMNELARSPALLAEAQRFAHALTDRARPASRERIAQVISRRFATFPQPNRSDEEWREFWADYFHALKDVPAESLEAGMREWVGTDTSGFLPKPGQLAALCRREAEPLWKAASRARKAFQIQSPTPASKMEDAERARMRALVAEDLKRIGSLAGSDFKSRMVARKGEAA